MAKIILFVDAMEPREYGEGWKNTERGLIESGYPKVTPKVTSEVYSGMSPSQNGMGSVHSMSNITTDRPHAPTIQEKLEMAGHNVISLHMPYCLPLQLQNQAWVSTSMGQQSAGENPLAQMCIQPPVGGDLTDSSKDWDRIYNNKVEDLYAKSSSMLGAMNTGDFDVAFIGIRTPDEYTHFQWNEDYRTMFLEILAQEIGRWTVNHDILWWSDHGSEEKKETFRVNRWLMEKGYLNLDVDVEYAERFSDDVKDMNPQANQGQDIDNQIGIQQPGVEIKDDSVALCLDPYDSCIDIIDDEFDEQELIDEMIDTGYYDGVGRTEDIWGEGQFIEHCPDIVTLRADNVLVTGNVHPDPIGMGFMRSGVHSAYGAWGTTDENLNRTGDIKPTEFHDIIWEFITGTSQMEQEVQQRISQMEQQMEHQQNVVENLQENIQLEG